nr:hypothetical protein [Tanacetum cinerariifolium]
MPCGATTLEKHVMKVRHVIWMNKVQDVWRIRKILISKIWWMMNIFKWSGSNLGGDLEIQEVVMRHVVVEIDLKGPVAICPSLTHRGYLVTFVVEEVLEGLVLSE